MDFLDYMRYIKARMYELNICIHEFAAGNRLGKSNTQRVLENNMLVAAHSIEKGMGLKETEPGHSSKDATKVLQMLKSYLDNNYDSSRFAFMESLRIMMAYIDYQQQFDLSTFEAFAGIMDDFMDICQRVGKEKTEEIRRNYNAGSRIISRDELLKGTRVNFKEFIGARHSMRMYADMPISISDIRDAVETANLSPSACNRQPTDVYFCNKPDKVRLIDSLVTGSNGFKGDTPNYIIITTDRSCFSKHEQFQWYINGGIYLAFLTLSLHSIGIGTCIMQWRAFHKNEKKIKQIAGIASSEAIIAIVGCGYYADDSICIYAQRKDADETLHIL